MPVECTICVVVFVMLLLLQYGLRLFGQECVQQAGRRFHGCKGLHIQSVRVLEYQLMLSGACSSDAEHSSDTGLAARELESARDQPTERVILRFRLSLSLSQQSLSLRCT